MKTLLYLLSAGVTVIALFLVQGVSPRSSEANHVNPDVGIDGVTTSNTGSFLGTIDTCAKVSGVGATTTIDVYVKNIPADIAGDPVHDPAGLGTLGASVMYTSSAVKVTGVLANGLFLGSSPFLTNNSLPDTDGFFDFIAIDAVAPYNNGQGAVLRVTLEGVAVSLSTPLNLTAVIMADGNSDGYVMSAQSPVAAQVMVGGSGNCNDFDGDGWCDPGKTSTTANPCTAGPNDNCPFIANPSQADTDGDGKGDVCDPDTDGDGLGDSDELIAGTNPNDSDSDDDGLCDGRLAPQCAVGEDINNNAIVGASETSPADADSDDDGLSDGLERGRATPETAGTNTGSPNWQADLNTGTTTNPLNPDTDGDGFSDGAEDANHNGRVDAGETDPNVYNDFDGDGVLAGDNCPLVANGPAQAGTPGVGNQTNSDLANQTAGFQFAGAPLLGDANGDACDSDDDNDGTSDADERIIFTVSAGSAQERTPCRAAGVNDPWPQDIYGNGGLPDRLVDGQDLVSLLPGMFKGIGQPGYSARLDIFQPGSIIDGQDLVAILPYMFKTCQSP